MGDGLKQYRIDQPGALRLARYDPAAKPFDVGDKAANKSRVAELSSELATVQVRFYAGRGRCAMSIDLQTLIIAVLAGYILGMLTALRMEQRSH